MKREQILTALEEISDTHIAETGKPPKRNKRVFWMRAVAAMLVAVLGIHILFGPARIRAYAVALPGEARVSEWPDRDDYDSQEEWKEAYDLWDAERKLRQQVSGQVRSDVLSFFTKGSEQFLSTEGNENKLWSPVNAYIGLAMMTELTEGNTQKQILSLFGAADTQELREKVSAVWESIYQNERNEICILANSLWIEKGLEYNQEVMDALGYYYYASVYQGDLGSDRTNKDIANWLNNNTGNFLKNSTDTIRLSQETLLAAYSTLYFQSKWSDQFDSSKNIKGVFYMPAGETQVTYMRKDRETMGYYWADDYSAVCLRLRNECSMWFILPDEGKTTEDVLEDGTYMEMVLSDHWQDSKDMRVNLSVPKFDVSSKVDLKEGLMRLGVTDIFDDRADFSGVTSEEPIFLFGVNQSVRVEIDEEGVKAATYIELPGGGSAQPAEEIIDFVLDRPFLFVITNANLPLFVGCVNCPQE